LDFPGEKGIERFIAWLAVAGPLRVQVCLRPGVELLA